MEFTHCITHLISPGKLPGILQAQTELCSISLLDGCADLLAASPQAVAVAGSSELVSCATLPHAISPAANSAVSAFGRLAAMALSMTGHGRAPDQWSTWLVDMQTRKGRRVVLHPRLARSQPDAARLTGAERACLRVAVANSVTAARCDAIICNLVAFEDFPLAVVWARTGAISCYGRLKGWSEADSLCQAWALLERKARLCSLGCLSFTFAPPALFAAYWAAEPLLPAPPREACAACGGRRDSGVYLWRCSGCKRTSYCSQFCSGQDWWRGHKDRCWQLALPLHTAPLQMLRHFLPSVTTGDPLGEQLLVFSPDCYPGPAALVSARILPALRRTVEKNMARSTPARNIVADLAAIAAAASRAVSQVTAAVAAAGSSGR